MLCKFPGCEFPAVRDGYCVQHGRVYGSERKKTKGIANFSAKRKEKQKEYAALVKAMLEENKKCEIRAEGCTTWAQGLHHIEKRNEHNLCDRRNLLRACNNCNNWIERNPKKAEENGWAKSKFKTTVRRVGGGAENNDTADTV